MHSHCIPDAFPIVPLAFPMLFPMIPSTFPMLALCFSCASPMSFPGANRGGQVRVRRCVRDGKVHRVRQVSLLMYSVYCAVAQVKVKLSIPGKAGHAHSAEGGELSRVWPAHPPTVLRSPQILDSPERRTVPPSPPPHDYVCPCGDHGRSSWSGDHGPSS